MILFLILLLFIIAIIFIIEIYDDLKNNKIICYLVITNNNLIYGKGMTFEKAIDNFNSFINSLNENLIDTGNIYNYDELPFKSHDVSFESYDSDFVVIKAIIYNTSFDKIKIDTSFEELYE